MQPENACKLDSMNLLPSINGCKLDSMNLLLWLNVLNWLIGWIYYLPVKGLDESIEVTDI